MSRLKIIFGILAVSFLLMACEKSPNKNEMLEVFVNEFHEKVNYGEYEGIYENSLPEFKKGISKDDFIKSMGKVSKTLGPMTKSRYVGMVKTKGSLGQSLVSVQYESEFKNGVASETFFLDTHEGVARLFQYNINSDHLIKQLMTQ